MEIVTSPLHVKRRKIVIAGYGHLPRRLPSRKLQKGRVIPTPPLMQLIMKYAVPVVLALLILQYQNNPEALFRENPAPTWCFVAATCVYWLMVGATKQNMGRKWYEKLRRAALACGILSALSLLSMFLPYPASLLPLLVWMPLALLLTWPTACLWIRRRITIVIVTKIQALLVRARGLVSTNQPPILPV